MPETLAPLTSSARPACCMLTSWASPGWPVSAPLRSWCSCSTSSSASSTRLPRSEGPSSLRRDLQMPHPREPLPRETPATLDPSPISEPMYSHGRYSNGGRKPSQTTPGMELLISNLERLLNNAPTNAPTTPPPKMLRAPSIGVSGHYHQI